MNNNIKLPPNSLAFIALANEYCHTIENIRDLERAEFIAAMLKLLPRLYIVVTDIDEYADSFDVDLQFALSEQEYDQTRSLISMVMAHDDVYLEVFEEDMKYSDTPIAATISENLSDLYQEFFNLVYSVKDADTYAQIQLLALCKEDFKEFWGQTLCNVLRALHAMSCAPQQDEDEYLN